MADIPMAGIPVETASGAEIAAAPALAAARGASPGGNLLRHARYVVAGNPVTALSFGLFFFLVLCAALGPSLVPYDPLASDTARALQAPSAQNLFGTDHLGRDILSRVVAATRLDMGIAVFSVALVFAVGGLAGVAAGFFGGWTDRIVGRLADTIMAFPLFVLAMGIVAALGNTVTNIVLATAIVNFPLYARIARAEALVRLRAGGAAHRQPRVAGAARHHPAQHPADHGGADVAHHGLRHPQRRRVELHRPRRAAADAGVGDHGGGGGVLHGVRRVVGGAVPGAGVDARRVLLQPARRRPARHRRSPAADLRA